MKAALLTAVLILLPALAPADCRDIGRWRLCDGIRPMYRAWRFDTPRARPEPRRPFSYELDTRRSDLGGVESWRYRDSTGRRAQGTIRRLPGGTVVHRGRSN